MSDLGLDLATPLGDMDADSTEAVGVQCLAEDICARWETPPGGYPYDRNYGAGLLLWLGKAIDINNPEDANLWELEQVLSLEAAKDERVLGMTVTIVPEQLEHTKARLLITGNGFTARGPFRMVAAVSDTLELLEVA